MDRRYGSQKGRIGRGSVMFDVRRGPSSNIHYTDEVIEEEAHGAGDGLNATFGPFVTDWTPIRAGTVKIKDGTRQLVDDGNGNLTGDGTGTVNYGTGSITAVFAVAPAAGDAVTVDYEYDSEAQSPPEIELVMSSSPVTARSQRLKYLVSVESQQNFQAYFGGNADVELTAYMSKAA